VRSGIMTWQALSIPHKHGHLLGDVPALLIVAVVLAILTVRATQPRKVLINREAVQAGGDGGTHDGHSNQQHCKPKKNLAFHSEQIRWRLLPLCKAGPPDAGLALRAAGHLYEAR
jgi:hypothetical protein